MIPRRSQTTRRRRGEELLRQQQATGGWTSEYGDAYGTSMALIILQMPHRYLPIFQK